MNITVILHFYYNQHCRKHIRYQDSSKRNVLLQLYYYTPLDTKFNLQISVRAYVIF